MSNPNKARRPGRARQVWREQLLIRLLVYFLLLSLVPLSLVAAIAFNQGRQALERNVLDHLTTTATLKEEEIDRWMTTIEHDVELLAQNPMLSTLAVRVLLLEEGPGNPDYDAAYEALHKYLRLIQTSKGDLAELMILRGVGGQVVVSTDYTHEGAYEVTSSFFTEGRRRTYVQNVYSSANTGEPTMTIATPLKLPSSDIAAFLSPTLDPDEMGVDSGEVLGVLAAHVNLDRLDELMTERGGLGTTGETYLVDRLNRFVSQARFGRQEFPRGVHTDGIDMALVDKVDGAGVYNNYREVPVIGAYRWVDERDVALLAEVEQSEALAPARQLATTILLVGLGVGVVVVAVGYWVARQISRPILELAGTSARMAGGELDQAVVSSQVMGRRDEIGMLARAFDDMAVQLRGAIGGLESRVEDRTQELEQRALQLATAADVGRAAASILDLRLLVPQVVELVRDRFDLYYAGLFLVDDAGEQAVLEAGTGEPGRLMKHAGHKLAVGGQSMVGSACSTRQPQIALDIVHAAGDPAAGAVIGQVGLRRGARFDNPLLPDTRSEMALPLLVGERVLGALDVQSTREAAFSESDIAVLQLVADQVAVAVDNARKFSEEAGLLEATSPLYRMSHRLAAATSVDQVNTAIVDTVAETEADGCTVAQFDLAPDGTAEGVTFLARSAFRESLPPGDTGMGPDLMEDLGLTSGGERGVARIPTAASELLSWSLMRTFTIIEDVVTDDRLSEQARQVLQAIGVRAVVLVPLRARSRPGEGEIGFVMIDRATAGPFSPVSLRLYETLADQAVAALERARLLEASQQQAWREHRIRAISDKVSLSFDLEQLLRAAVEDLSDLVGAAGGHVEMGPASMQPAAALRPGAEPSAAGGNGHEAATRMARREE